MERAVADKLDEASLLRAYYYDREMPDGSFRVVSVPVDHRRRAADGDMPIREINILTADQRNRLTEIEDAIASEDMHLEVLGLHPLLDDIVGRVECPYEGYRTRDLTTISLFVFNRAPRLKLTAESVAAEYALRRDQRYGL